MFNLTPTHICHDTKKARKDHQCFHCLETIRKGTYYETNAFSFEGSAYSLKTHTKCDEKAEEVKLYDQSMDGVSEGDLREFLMGEHLWEEHLKALGSVCERDTET